MNDGMLPEFCASAYPRASVSTQAKSFASFDSVEKDVRTIALAASSTIEMIRVHSTSSVTASSRTLMARLAPKGMEGEIFGLYALAGAATAWLGPLLVEQFTHATGSLRAGFGSIGVLLAAGLVVLLFVKPPKSGD